MQLTKDLMEKIPNLPKEQVIGIFEKYLGPIIPNTENTKFNCIDLDYGTISFDFVIENTNIPVVMPVIFFLEHLNA